ncbi:hypothetical protein DFQ28_002866 [Apophysomyces sp. BC1034]|nr:hypothetical protein DFQ30_003218 [Apophysomyces sp. BC1015]KAG0179380.1 hypothetical protein DFQ29_002166 [Apophysomyces sp. BC1021]KAG0189821.1 hypothetical protein DFQ28_002866 [Apophysomyces sp. BC1034]
MTISLKNCILWNPSSDVNTPNHAFHENATVLLTRLCQIYDVYLIIHINSENERNEILGLLENASVLSQLDSRKILYCSTEKGKVHMIRHIDPQIHVEGGWELDDGEDIVRTLRPHVQKLLWVITRRRRSSFNQSKLKDSDQGILGPNVELTDQFMDSSLAREVGFSMDQ